MICEYRLASLDVKLQGKSFIHSFSLLFVCFLGGSFDHLCVCLEKKQKKTTKKTSYVGPVEEWAGARQKWSYMIFSIAKILLKLCRCTCWSGTLLVLCFLGCHPIFHVYFLLQRPKDLDQTVQVHMHTYANLELCWSDVSLESLYISFKFFLFLQKSSLVHISLMSICCKDPDQTVWMLIILTYQTSLIPHST